MLTNSLECFKIRTFFQHGLRSNLYTDYFDKVWNYYDEFTVI